jgi:hypothetical protein
MPRLNTSTYLHHHYQLKSVWEIDQRPFTYLSQTDQWDLHKYFQFASDKTGAELIEHRRNVHALDPSLPQRAGRAYAKLVRGEQAPVTYSVLPDGHRISIRAVVRPEPDLKLLAKACVWMALKELKHQEEDDQAA